MANAENEGPALGGSGGSGGWRGSATPSASRCRISQAIVAREECLLEERRRDEWHWVWSPPPIAWPPYPEVRHILIEWTAIEEEANLF